MIYLLESINYYKIGFTKDEDSLEKRLKSYKTHNPEFDLIDLYHGDIKDETNMHNLCKEYLHQGKWFKKDNFILDSLSNLQKLPKDKIERIVLNIVGNFDYMYYEDVDDPEQISRDCYTYHNYYYNKYAINFDVLLNNEMIVTITDLTTLKRKQLYFYCQNIKTYFIDYCEKSDFRQFSGILFDSGYILLSVRERGKTLCVSWTELGPIYYSELISPEIKEAYGCFTREDFKPISI